MRTPFIPLLAAFSLIAGSCSGQKSNSSTQTKKTDTITVEQKNIDTAVLAGGCFWCLDAVYRRMKGVINVEAGYSNGTVKNPTYKEVCTGTTGHAEVVLITYDTSIASYADILEVFWKVHDPTTLNRQGNDIGTQYRSGIYYINAEQRAIAEKSKEAVKESKLWDGTIHTEILQLDNYSAAEEYHQNYAANNPDNTYCVYVVGEKVAKFKKAFKDKLKPE